MRKPKKIDVYEKIQDFQHQTLFKKPSKEDMVHEVQMMNFKIRPLAGKIADLDFSNSAFLDALWSLGKLEEFFRCEFGKVARDEQETFFRLVDELRINFQQKLNRTHLGIADQGQETRHMFEVEIIKDNNFLVN